jgi:exodeoxyribonuclease VII large subunit
MAQNVLSITQLTEYIRGRLDDDPFLGQVAVRGEISNYKVYPSGHHYFTLKDEGAALKCVMFKGNAMRLRFRPDNGMKVIAMGKVTVYPRDGAYQLYCAAMAMDGVGDLYAAFEQLKKKLAAQGLFDPAHKKPLPKCPGTIGIVTSSAGAAVHDMLRILRKRYPLTKVRLLPVRVQGAEAPAEIAGALRYANKWRVADLIITGRGGGSIEDLWAFNDERVARAIYESDLPVISAVGHEPDVTISDFVADARASTPSNAAEIAVPDQEELRRRLGALQTRMEQSERKRVKNLREQFEKTARSRVLQDPMAFIDDKRLLLDYTQKNLASLARQQTAQRMQQFASLAAKLDALSPLSVLGRGYAVARTEDGQILRAAQDVSVGEKIEVLLGQGSLNCTVDACNTGGYDDGKNV